MPKLIFLLLRIILILSLPFWAIHSTERRENLEPLIINMEEAEGIGLTNNVILASLKDRREVFKMMATEKWRNYLPRVGISYFGLRNANVNQPDSQYNDIRVQLNQLLYDGGENALEIESAKLQELLNQEDWKIAREKMILDIRKAYVRLLSSEVKSYVAEKSYFRTLKQLNDVKAERREGFLTELQELEISNKLHELELNLLKSKSQHSLNEIELKKQINLPLEVSVKLKDSLVRDYVLYPPYFVPDEESIALTQKPEIKKAKIAIENLKTRKEITENYWKPKLFVGGYYGENTNGALPVKNEVYGFSFSVQTQLGSSTNQTSANYGMQTDGTGIQRIPGFGPQFVGRGENAFNSNTLNLFDDLSYSRKIYEGKIGLSDAVRSNKLLEITVQAEAYKAKEKFKESWQTLSLMNSKFILSLQTWKSVQAKFTNGFVKEADLLGAEFELIKTIDELSTSLSGYLESGMDYSYALAQPLSELRFYEIQRDNGNSILFEILKNETAFHSERGTSVESLPKNNKSVRKKSEYQFYLEE
jgi:hypothetical protein